MVKDLQSRQNRVKATVTTFFLISDMEPQIFYGSKQV